jgi:hypothetical protein
MKKLLSILIGCISIIVLLGIGATLWFNSMLKDDGGASRPTYGLYTWKDGKTPRGGPTPRADGYVKGSLGHDLILPPMPPERPMDIHRKDSVDRNNTIRTCFWPGPKLRSGFYTTDPDNYGFENQLPDTMNTFSTAWFRIPAGANNCC